VAFAAILKLLAVRLRRRIEIRSLRLNCRPETWPCHPRLRRPMWEIVSRLNCRPETWPHHPGFAARCEKSFQGSVADL